MEVAMIGTGFVGLATGLAFAKKGHQVWAMDVDSQKIEQIKQGILPFYEKGLQEELSTQLDANFFPTTDLEEALSATEYIFVCVGTPSRKDGMMETKFLENAVKTIGRFLSNTESEKYRLIVIRSTVLPGTSQKLIKILTEESGKQPGKDFGVAVSPEFLREGTAFTDACFPERIVIGVSCELDRIMLEKFFSPFLCTKVITNLATAEISKYASNTFLALKITFANEISNLIDALNNSFEDSCDSMGINVDDVMQIVGMDSRINSQFLKAGVGFGGSCLPKDISGLSTFGESIEQPLPLLRAVQDVNTRQPLRTVDALKERLGSLTGKQIGLLGLSFKPGTDDIRDAPAIPIIEALLREGAIVSGFDPKAEKNLKTLFPELQCFPSPEDLVSQAEGVIIVTEWTEIVDYFSQLQSSPKIPVIDGRGVTKHATRSLGRDSPLHNFLIQKKT